MKRKFILPPIGSTPFGQEQYDSMRQFMQDAAETETGDLVTLFVEELQKIIDFPANTSLFKGEYILHHVRAEYMTAKVVLPPDFTAAHSYFTGITFTGPNPSENGLIGAFKDCTLTNVRFEGIDFLGVTFENVRFESVTFKNCNLLAVRFINSNIEELNLINCGHGLKIDNILSATQLTYFHIAAQMYTLIVTLGPEDGWCVTVSNLSTGDNYSFDTLPLFKTWVDATQAFPTLYNPIHALFGGDDTE